MPSPTIIELIYLVCIAHVWSRGSIFLHLRTLGIPSNERAEVWRLNPQPLRRAKLVWIALADCPLCSGFWIGVLGHFFIPANVVYVLGVGSIVGSFALALCALIRRL